jgi:sulfate transport system substrate-binding protein
VVYAFSSQEEALTQGIFPAFQQTWEAETGQVLSIEGVFGPSGSLVGQINLGAPADIAIFSNQRHADCLKGGKFVNQDTAPVMIAFTPLVIITRPDNPASLAEFADLTKPGLQLLHADPRSSGAGEWAVLAEYGSAYLETKSHETAKTQLQDIWRNVSLVGSSARATLTLFELGAGDALVTYEQDALLAKARGVPMEIIEPKRTILARHFAVIVDGNVTYVERPIVEAFLAFLQSSEGQQIFNQFNLRSANLDQTVTPDLLQPFTEEDLGGWGQAYSQLIENLWKTEIEPGLSLDDTYSFLGRGD